VRQRTTSEMSNSAPLGNKPKKTSILKFAKATGLKFAGKNSTITGEVEFLTSKATNLKVYI